MATDTTGSYCSVPWGSVQPIVPVTYQQFTVNLGPIAALAQLAYTPAPSTGPLWVVSVYRKVKIKKRGKQDARYPYQHILTYTHRVRAPTAKDALYNFRLGSPEYASVQRYHLSVQRDWLDTGE